MKVTPLDIRRKEFRRSVRGYLDEDVDVFLDSVADEVERVAKVNTELQQKVKTLEGQVAGHAQIREALEKTLVAAQLQSEEIRSSAQKESQSMLREAEAKAKAVVDDFYAQTRAVQQTLMQLKLLEEDFRFKFKSLLEGYLKLLEEGPILLSGVEDGGLAVRVGGSVAAEHAGPEVEAPAPDIDDSPTSETMEAQALSAPEGGAADKETGVYFGRMEGDPDDPFPEIGGDPSKPRDFEW